LGFEALQASCQLQHLYTSKELKVHCDQLIPVARSTKASVLASVASTLGVRAANQNNCGIAADSSL
jgi:hypothetical protein